MEATKQSSPIPAAFPYPAIEKYVNSVIVPAVAQDSSVTAIKELLLNLSTDPGVVAEKSSVEGPNAAAVRSLFVEGIPITLFTGYKRMKVLC